jgi:hypothetical protein
MRLQRNSGNTSTQSLGLRYTAETADSIRFAGKKVTLSFWARVGSNYSASGNGFRAVIATGTGTDQVVHSFTGFTAIADQTFALTTSWARYSVTGTCASSITQIGLEMFAYPTGTAGANDFVEITGLQLEEGSVATEFSRAMGTVAGELNACFRYFWRWGDGAGEFLLGQGGYYSSTAFYASVQFPVRMRATPTLLAPTGTNFYRISRNGATNDVNSLTAQGTNDRVAWVFNNTQATGTAGHFGLLSVPGGSSAPVDWSIEL